MFQDIYIESLQNKYLLSTLWFSDMRVAFRTVGPGFESWEKKHKKIVSVRWNIDGKRQRTKNVTDIELCLLH